MIYPHPKPVPTRKQAPKGPKAKGESWFRKRRNTPRRIHGAKNPALVAWIHTLPCHRCHVMRGERQRTPTECSHMPFSRRFGDEGNVWPLCHSCHTGAKDSWHHAKRDWFAHPYSRGYVAFVSELYTEKFYRESPKETP